MTPNRGPRAVNRARWPDSEPGNEFLQRFRNLAKSPVFVTAPCHQRNFAPQPHDRDGAVTKQFRIAALRAALNLSVGRTINCCGAIFLFQAGRFAAQKTLKREVH
jgi:hypothetical protein